MSDDRPVGIVILAVLQGLIALGLLAIGALLVFGAAIAATGILAIIVGVAGWIFLVGGVLGLAIAVGVWSGQTWAWYLSLIFGLISIVADIVMMRVSGNPDGYVFGLIVEGIILLYILSGGPREYFDIELKH